MNNIQCVFLLVIKGGQPSFSYKTVMCFTLAKGLSCDVGYLYHSPFLPSLQGARGDAGTKGGPGPRGNRGQRVCFQTSVRLCYHDHIFEILQHKLGLVLMFCLIYIVCSVGRA